MGGRNSGPGHPRCKLTIIRWRRRIDAAAVSYAYWQAIASCNPVSSLMFAMPSLSAPLEELPLDASEGFLLSRLDGRTRVADLPVLTGLPKQQIAAALQKLVEVFQETQAVLDGVQEVSGGTAELVQVPQEDLQAALDDVEADTAAQK